MSLVGAGPGDLELLTIKGLRRLQEADVVVYDRLIPRGLLARARTDAELVFAGKRPRGVDRDQAWINSLLVERAREGKRVVRLKGGDPFVFGRGGEEASALQDAGIPWEVVPGVTSPVAVLAYAGIPLTDRRFSSSFALVTGHVGAASGDAKAPWRELAGRVDTLVCLMATRHMDQITRDLLSDGLNPETPSAVVQRGTGARQVTVTAPLRAIAQQARRAGIDHPSILVVGNVVSLKDTLAWYEKLPLFGLRVAVPFGSKRPPVLTGLLSDSGAEVVELPVQLGARRNAQALPGIREVHEDSGDPLHLACYASPREVRQCVAMLDSLLGVPSATLGLSTARTARKLGMNVVVDAGEGSAQELVDAVIRWSLS